MKKIYTLASACLLMLFSFLKTEAATKTWQLTSGSGAWTTGSNWSGGTTPVANDVIDFSLGGTVTVTAVPTFTANQLLVSGSTNVTLVPSAAANTLTIAGASGTDFSIGSGSSLTQGSGTSYMSLVYSGSSNVGTIDGTYTLVSTSTTSGQNSKFDATNSVTTVNGTFTQNNNAGTAAITSSTTTLVINGTYNHSGFTGGSGGTIPTATWNSGSTCNITGIVGATSVGGGGQTFNNLTWNCTSQTSSFSFAAAIVAINGTLSVQSTGSGSLRLNANTASYTLSGNSSTGIGGISITSGTLDLVTGTGQTTINLVGNISQTGGTIQKSGSSTGTINFVKSSGTQTFTQSSGTIANNINWNVGDGTTTTNTVQLSSNVNLGTGTGTVTVKNGATLDCQGNVLSGSCAFTTNSGGGLTTTHASGFSTTAATGAVQTSGTKTFNAATNYTFNGSSAQATGNAIVNGANNLTINNSAGVTLTSACSVSGTLILTSGVLDIGNNDLSITNNATSAISGGTSTAYVFTSGIGQLKRAINNSGLPLTYAFPVGLTSTYSPASFTFNSLNAASTLGIQVVSSANGHPNMGTQVDYFKNRYWATTFTGTTYNYTSAFTYVAADLTGSASNIFLNCWNGSAWTQDNTSSATGSPTYTVTSGTLSETTFPLTATSNWSGRVNNPVISYEWTGNTNSSWQNSGNWSPSGIPTSTDNVNIGNQTINFNLIITGNESCTNFSTTNSGTFTVNNGASLSVSGTVSAGSSVNPTLVAGSSVSFSTSSPLTIPAWSYSSLNASGGNRTFVNGSTTYIGATFTSGSGTYTTTGSTVEFNGTSTQSIPALSYNNLTVSNTSSITLPSGAVGIAGTFTPGSATYTVTGNTIDFNGTGAQTIPAFNYNNLTISGAHTTNNITFANGGTVGIAGTFTPSATFTTGNYDVTNNTIDFNSSGSQTIPAFSYNNLSNTNNGARTLSGVINIDGTYSPSTGTITVGTSTINFSSASAQTIPATFYYTLSNLGNGPRTWASSGTIDIKNSFSPGSGIQTITNSTIKFTQASGSYTLTNFTTNIASRQYFNLIIAPTTSVTYSPGAGVDIGVAGDLTVTNGVLNIGYATTASTMTVDGNTTLNGGTLQVCTSSSNNNGTLNLNGNLTLTSGSLTRGSTLGTGVATINFQGGATQSISQSAGTLSNQLQMFVTNSTTLTLSTVISATGTSPVFTVNSGSSIDFGTNVFSGSATSTFALNSGATLITANTAGITSSGATGSVQTNTRTYNAAANYTFNGASAQATGNGFSAANNLTINNSSNVSLSSSATVTGNLGFTSGSLVLGTSNLTLNGTFSGQSGSSYVKTNSTGQLKRTCGTGGVTFIVGNTNYNPIDLDNTGGTSDVYGIRVVDALNNANDATYGVSREWVITEATASGSNLIPYMYWSSGQEGSNFFSGTQDKAGLYNQTTSTWTELNGITSGAYTTNPSTAFTPSDLSTGTFYFAAGRDNAFIISPNAPSITTTTVTNRTEVGADLGATLVTDNGTTISDYGTVWSTSSNPVTNSSSNGTFSGSFTFPYTDTRTGMNPQTQYHARGFATNSFGTAYSNDLSFYTVSNPPTAEATSFSGTPVSGFQINLSWSVGTFPGSGATANGYIILSRNDGNNPTTSGVVDGTDPASLTLPSGTSLVTIVTSGATTSFNNTGLTIQTQYNYIIIPFTWDNTNGATYNYYLTNAPNCNATTPDATLSSDYFQTVTGGTSGNLSSIGTWESSHNNATWISATAVPTTSANTVTVRSGFNLGISSSVSVDQLNINSGGEVTVNSGVTLTVNDGTGTDLTVDGKLTNSGTVTLSGSATAVFNSGSTYNHNQNNNSSNITSSASTTWDANSNFEVTGWTNSTTTTLWSATIHYGNVRWNSPSQTATLNAQGALALIDGNLRISNNGGGNTPLRLGSGTFTVTILGDLIIDGGKLNMMNTTAGTQTLNIGGNFNITSGDFNFSSGSNSSSTSTINLSGTSKTFTNAGNLNTNAGSTNNWVFTTGSSYTLANNIPVGSTRSCTVNGSLMMGTNLATGAGSFVVAATGTLGIGDGNGIVSSGASGNVQTTTRTFNASATYIYNGSVAQFIGTGLPSPVANLVINNTNASGVSLSAADITISSLLTLSKGTLNTSTNKVIISNTAGNAVVNGGSNSAIFDLSWIVGNLRRNIATNTDTYFFPVGLSSVSNLLTLVNNNLTGITYIDGTIAPKAGNDVGLNLQVSGTWVTSVASEGEWQITPDALPSGGTYDLLMYFGGFSGMFDNQFSILERPDGSSNAADWVVPSGSTTPANGSAGMTVAGGYAERLGMSTFSRKGIGHLGAPLPIQLVSFTGVNQNDVNVLNWTTLTEENSDYFEIEHSTNGKDWSTVGTMDAAGYSVTEKSYSLTDANPAKAINYYRIKSVDLDRAVSYSKVISIDNRNATADYNFYPNPVADVFTIDLNGECGSVYIYAMDGKLMLTKSFNSADQHISVSTQGLASGIYNLIITSNQQTTIKKLVKE